VSESSGRLPRTDLKGYFQGIGQRLDLQFRLMTPVVAHSGEMGDNDHAWFADFLRQYLPLRIGVDTGFVVNCDSDKSSANFFAAAAEPRGQDKSIGPQSDILLLDVINNAPFCVEKTFRVCPVEMVLGVIEVTRSLTLAKLRDDSEKIGRVIDLARKQSFGSFVGATTAEHRGVPGFIVAFESDVAEETLVSTLEGMPAARRPIAVLVANKALYVFFKDRSFKLAEAPLFKFLALMRRLIERLPLGSTDLYGYLPAMAQYCDPTDEA
jgi:hypothetical protein